MRRRFFPIVVSMAAVALALSSCGTDSDDIEKPPSDSETPVELAVASSPRDAGTCGPSSSTLDPATVNPELPADTAAITGDFGTKPAMTFPEGVDPSAELQTFVMAEGTGPELQDGQVMIANYLGQVWDGTEAFDNSYDRGAPFSVNIGAGQVIPGWDKGLVGQKTGSRVMLSIPPEDGYGAGGNEQAGIKGTDTLVFVIDIIQVCDASALAENAPTPVADFPADIPQISGDLRAEPVIKISPDTKEPTKVVTTVYATGDGPEVAAGAVAVQFNANTWKGASAGTTWNDTGSLTVMPVGLETGTDPIFDGLIGLPVGSRVLLQLPATSEQEAMAVVVDIVSQPS